jgi:hypothetical protein
MRSAPPPLSGLAIIDHFKRQQAMPPIYAAGGAVIIG